MRIYQRPGDEPGTERTAVTVDGTVNPVLHLATVPLTAGRGDYGSGVVEALHDVDAFLALVEFDAEAAHTALFSAGPVPRAVNPEDLQPHTLQRVIAGQAGAQYFASESGRAFCLYVVVGAAGMRASVAQRLNAALGTLEIEPLPSAPPHGGAVPTA
ncbi:MAG: hypothetical protein ABWZ76_03355 [Acidimicrobiales bacterium]